MLAILTSIWIGVSVGRYIVTGALSLSALKEYLAFTKTLGKLTCSRISMTCLHPLSGKAKHRVMDQERGSQSGAEGARWDFTPIA